LHASRLKNNRQACDQAELYDVEDEQEKALESVFDDVDGVEDTSGSSSSSSSSSGSGSASASASGPRPGSGSFSSPGVGDDDYIRDTDSEDDTPSRALTSNRSRLRKSTYKSASGSGSGSGSGSVYAFRLDVSASKSAPVFDLTYESSGPNIFLPPSNHARASGFGSGCGSGSAPRPGGGLSSSSGVGNFVSSSLLSPSEDMDWDGQMEIAMQNSLETLVEDQKRSRPTSSFDAGHSTTHMDLTLCESDDDEPRKKKQI